MAQVSPAPTPEGAAPSGAGGALFGRGMVYALVMALPLASAVLVAPFMTRLLGPTEYGLVAAAISLNQLFVSLALVGLDQAVMIQRAEDGNSVAARGLVATSFIPVTLTMGLALASLSWWAPAFGFPATGHVALLALAWTTPAAVVLMMGTLLLAENRLRPFALLSIISSVGAQVAALVAVLLGSPSATTYLYAMLAVSAASLVLGLVLSRPRWAAIRDVATTRRALALGLPMTVNAVAGYVLNAGDRILIQRELGPAEVGRYQAAYTVGNMVILVLYAVGQAWTPRFAEVRDRGERLALHRSSRDSLYRLLVPTVLGVTLAAPIALRVLVPASFDPGTLGIVVALIAIAAFPVAAGGASGRELLTLRRGRALAAATIGSAVLNVVLNLVLLPRVGIAGAAVATLLAFAFQAGAKLVLLPRSPRWPRTSPALWAQIAGCSVLAVATSWLPDTVPVMVARLVLALACVPWLLVELRRAAR